VQFQPLQGCTLNVPLTIAGLLLTSVNRIRLAKTEPTMPQARPSPAFQFCSRSLHAFVLKPEIPIEKWLGEADRWLSRSPGFFAGKPIVMDASALPPEKPVIEEVIAGLAARDVRVMGILGGNPELAGPDLPPLLPTSKGQTAESSGKKGKSKQAEPIFPSLLVESPVRSGQSIFHQGDVTVIGSVSSGAEIVATGSIHIYGTLRGRVLAGAEGNPRAHIFCKRIEAELIAIDGYYRMSEEITPLLGKSVHAWLDGGNLAIKPLD
jgi:septum site-determining protein MinC